MSEHGVHPTGAPSQPPLLAAHVRSSRAAAAEAALNLDFDLAGEPGRIIVRVGGELDTATAPALSDALLPLVDGKTADVVLDLDQVTFLGFTGLGVLADVRRQAQQTGTALRIIAANTVVTPPIMLTGLDKVFQLYETAGDLRPSPDPTGDPRPAGPRCRQGVHRRNGGTSRTLTATSAVESSSTFGLSADA